MNDPRINLLKDHFELNPNPKPSPWALGRYFFLTVLIGALIGIGFSFAMTKTDLASDSGEKVGFFRSFASFVTSGDRTLIGEDTDRVNVMLLGIGGAGHDGPDLSDTIIFTSLKPSTGDVGMMSIPRDLAIPIPGYGWRKINHANYFGELEDPGHGARYASGVIGGLIGQEIDYYVRIDFQGFEKFLNALGGVDVYVETAFLDPTYPTSDHLTQTIRFDTGWQHMDGETALQYARSRHGTNGEGSDFARSRRQQKILLAVKDKLFSANTILNPKRISDLIGTVKESIETNLSTWEILRLATFARNLDPEKITHYVLDSGPDSPLYETNLNGAYVLLPDNDDWSGIRTIAANVFEENPAFVPVTPDSIPQQLVRIRIENGTDVSGLAFRTSQLLEGQGFEVASVANSNNRDWDHTVIYDFTEGQYPEALKELQAYLKADVATTVTGWLFTDDLTPRTITLEDEGLRDGSVAPSVDFLIVLGQNSANLVQR
ncbi:hypothetical protein COV06_02835 [Candidatus Uhrbacteria bacterium CG10_big_fil_rev_8_21_14_0_10_50_16]|uniref:Cell envelope-related transcriptional attenuator domain-containing protein n=1 Tax=Candidatus Uhrbacteria bacterium CG10_big_fil_rev_8_21_14_0_10_50_16 TaxID=1975039 RepID=A0A2H0RM69_9BACT|nr:MAG: hypothetical protein COV06_02835 [Candidatus Uhrbacteria bacterium CG10_big_fil_rev_8_21_14_0_10_50_16]